jgi:hypothetical protein
MSDRRFEEHIKQRIDNSMWDKLLNHECRTFMKNLVRDEVEVIGEDDKVIDSFFNFLKGNIQDYKVVVVLATQWIGFDDTKQANMAINYVGWKYASHFIMLMDYLSNKFIKGELK